MQELVEGNIIIHYVVKSEDQRADLGTKHLSKHCHRNVINIINEFKASNAKISSSSRGRSSSFCARITCVLITIFIALCSYLQRRSMYNITLLVYSR